MSPPGKDAEAKRQERASDHALARNAAAGDEEAQRALARRLLVRARTTVRYLCGDSPDHLDLVQECLMELLLSIDGFRGESRLETWADRIVVRTALRLLHRERRRPETPDPHLAEDTADLSTPESWLQKARLRSAVAALYQKLSPERRAVVVLQAVYGYSTPEIAALTDTGLETVRSRLKMARKQLRRLVGTEPALREWLQREP